MGFRKMTRPVSVIGVGATQFGDVLETPEMKGLSWMDLGAWAAYEALEDAGMNPRDVGHLAVAAITGPFYLNETVAANNTMREQIGMKFASSTFHTEACGAAFVAFTDAVDAVASGRVDVAMALSPEVSRNCAAPDMPPCYLWPASEYKNLYGRDFLGADKAFDTSYNRWTGGWIIGMDVPFREYIRKTGITLDEMEQAMIGQTITQREHGEHNPIAQERMTWQQVAESRGFKTDREYLTSKFNPKISEYLRPAYFALQNDGAVAVIVCATDVAHKYKQKPIEIVGLVQCDLSSEYTKTKSQLTKEAIRQLYENTGYKPEDIEFVEIGETGMCEEMNAAEEIGYLPEGEGWKYYRDGLTRFDKEKPMNTSAASISVGHAFSATDLLYPREIVLQMRGQAGARQIPKPPKVSLLRGIGGGMSCVAAIFRTLD